MYYFNYFIKCCIRNLTRLLFKPKYLFTIVIILLVSFFLFKIDSLAVEVPEGNSVISYSVKDSITVDVSTREFISFVGFRCYYIPVRQGQKFGYTYDSSANFEVRTCYSENAPAQYGYAYSGSGVTSGNHSSGFGVLQNDLVSPIDGYFCVFVYPTSALDIAFFDRESVQDSIQNLGTTITENNDANTQKILMSNSMQSAAIRDTMTNTNYDEESINIDTSTLDDLQENQDILNYPMQLVQRLLDIVNSSNWDTVQIIDISIPHTDKKIQLRSDMLSNFIKNTALYPLIQTFWIFIFGRYMIHFGLRIYHWLRTGEAVRKTFNIDNEAITAALM